MVEEAAELQVKMEVKRQEAAEKRRMAKAAALAMGVEQEAAGDEQQSGSHAATVEERLAEVSSNSIEYDVLVPPSIRGLLHPSGLSQSDLSDRLRLLSDEFAGTVMLAVCAASYPPCMLTTRERGLATCRSRCCYGSSQRPGARG